MRRVFIAMALNLCASMACAQNWPESVATDQMPPPVYGSPEYDEETGSPDVRIIPPVGYIEPGVECAEPVCDPSWCKSPYENSAWRIELGITGTSSQVSSQAFGGWEDAGGVGTRFVLGHEDCDGLGIRLSLWGFGQDVDTPIGEVELHTSTANIDLYKRFFVKNAELVVGGGSVGGNLEYDLNTQGQSAEFHGGGVSIFGEAYYPFARFARTDIGQVVRARFSLMSGRWDDNGSPFMSDTYHDTMSILDIGWGIELRHRFGKLEDKFWYISIVPEFQRWESASLPNAFDPGFQGTSFNFGLAW